MANPSHVNVMEIQCICLENAIKITKKTSQFDIDQIIKKYKPIVGFKVRKALGGHTPEWEDVVHEVMMNVVEKLKAGQFRGDSSIGTFIYTITNRRIVDYIRAKSKVLSHAPEPHEFTTPDEALLDKERAKTLAAAIERLKPKYKEVLYLYYYKDLSREEVARKLDISPRRVSERVNYAQKLLKKILVT